MRMRYGVERSGQWSNFVACFLEASAGRRVSGAVSGKAVSGGGVTSIPCGRWHRSCRSLPAGGRRKAPWCHLCLKNARRKCDAHFMAKISHRPGDSMRSSLPTATKATKNAKIQGERRRAKKPITTSGTAAVIVSIVVSFMPVLLLSLATRCNRLSPALERAECSSGAL